MHPRLQAVHARELVNFLRQILVLLRLGDGEHGEVMNDRFEVFELGR